MSVPDRWLPTTELCMLSATLTRQHNNANMLALAGGFTGNFEAEKIVDVFLSTEFEGGRHATRVDMMMDIENC